ncbi:ATPase inhibitor [Paraconiothyrium brasiliense]|uniref:ATPase inhibitor, mitochondrial n=1 Tax=Paraconiothyrium brasiliense TaxID=300254 RepID=A0ABR3S6Q8_9PLEO
MFRTSVIKAARLPATKRCFSTSMRAMSAGDTGSGSSRSGGIRSGDAFTKRETAAEEMYIRQEERARLLAIRQKLQQQQKHIEELTKHIDEVTSQEGGQGEQPGEGKP